MCLVFLRCDLTSGHSELVMNLSEQSIQFCPSDSPKDILVYSQARQVGAVIMLSEDNTIIFTLIFYSSFDSFLWLLSGFWLAAISHPKGNDNQK